MATKNRLAMGPKDHGRSGARHELLEPKLVNVAPSPLFPRFDGTRDGMLRRPEMPQRMSVLGRVAAPDIAAFHAHPELQPRVLHQHAVVATRSARVYVADEIDVRARHGVLRQRHDERKVRISWPAVESNDGMWFMPRIDSTREKEALPSVQGVGAPDASRFIDGSHGSYVCRACKTRAIARVEAGDGTRKETFSKIRVPADRPE